MLILIQCLISLLVVVVESPFVMVMSGPNQFEMLFTHTHPPTPASPPTRTQQHKQKHASVVQTRHVSNVLWCRGI